MFRMVKKRRPGERTVIHTPREVVRAEFDGALVVAHCSGAGARRALERKGFKLVPATPQPKAKRARNEGGHFKADDPSTPEVDEAWSPPKKKSTTKKSGKKK